MEKYTIYAIRNKVTHDMVYIGCTKHPKKRWYVHKRRAFIEGGDQPLYHDIRNYGESSFKVIELETVVGDQSKADRKERLWIKALNCIYPNGYNLYSGGMAGWKIHPLTLKKNKGLYPKGHKPWTKGRPRPQEVKDKISATKAERNHPGAMTGKKQPIKTCPHCGVSGGAGGMGKWHFDNCKQKLQ